MIFKRTLIASFFLSLLFVTSAIIAEANCIFCKIVNHQAPAKIVAENNDVMAFETITPMYETHLIIVPKDHVRDLKSAQPAHTNLIGKLFMAASNLGKQLDGAQAFNVQVNNGAEAGQTIFHLHLHFKSQNKLVGSPKI